MSQNILQSENSKAIVNSIKFFASLIILAAVSYSEILFLGIIGSLFPPGPLAIGAMIGAVTTGLSILALCLGKSHWFRPGQQLIVAWIFTGIEVAVLIMNDILAYQLHTGAQLDQFSSTWRLFCVATPALSLVGWILLFYFSPERTIMHKRMELEDRQAKAKVDLDTAVHQKAMHFHYRAIDMVGSGMEREMERLMPAYTELAARQKLAAIASDLVGSHISHNQLTGSTPKQLPSRIVDADPVEEEEKEGELEEAASRTHVVDPTNVREKIDAEVKPIEKKSFKDKVKETINFSTPETSERTIVEDFATDEKPVKRTHQIQDDDPLADNYADSTDLMEEELDDDNFHPKNWNLVDWRAYRNEVDAWAFEKVWKQYHGEIPFPDDLPKTATKKSAAAKKKVSRREVLGMEKQEE